ncbi:MAG: SpoIVB peptidase [Clostridia bacterium]|nr:SpoIVB peptidase [Clostridia bacterium]
MKRFFRAVSAVITALLLGWYCVPSVYRILHIPEAVTSDPAISAPTLTTRSERAEFVRESGDERLHASTSNSYTTLLFGVLPLRTVAFVSDLPEVRLGGETIGIVLHTNGVQIIGIESFETETGKVSPAEDAGLKAGDMILSVNGILLTDAASLASLCRESDQCVLSCLRDGEAFSTTLVPAADRSGTRRIGVWVRDSTSGIGTLSFYDARTGVYAALGHGVTDVDTGSLLSPASGFLTDSNVLYARKGDGAAAGELVGSFSTDRKDAIATVERNTPFGITGTLIDFSDPAPETALIAPAAAAHSGDAYILTAVDGTVRAYSVRVIRTDVQSAPETRGMMIEITDSDLLEKTGGIVQGMSGSPLLQDGKLIGVVTHVFLNTPARGYCIYAEWMAEEFLPRT